MEPSNKEVVYCYNCGIPLTDIVIKDKDHYIAFCSYECLAEYKFCDGGDDSEE